MLASLGKMPTTLARRLTSLFSRPRVGGMDFQPVRRREELQMGQHLRLGLIHQGGGFGKARAELIGDLPPSNLGAGRVGLDEDLAHQGTDE